MKQRTVYTMIIFIMICSLLAVGLISPQGTASADKGGTHDCEPWPSCKDDPTEPPATDEPTEEPVVTNSPGECGPGEHDENGTCVPNGGGDDEGNPCGPGEHDENGTCVPNGGGGGNGCQNQGNGNGEEDQGGGNEGCEDPTETSIPDTPIPSTGTPIPATATEVVQASNTPAATATDIIVESTKTSIPATATEVVQASNTPISATATSVMLTPTATSNTPTITTDESTGCPWWKRWFGLCGGKPNSCTRTEPILYVEKTDVFSISDPTDTTPTNLTADFDYSVSQPDQYICQYVAVVLVDGQMDLALFDGSGFVKWLIQSPGDQISPTWTDRGTIVYRDERSMYEVNTNGNLIHTLGLGSNPVHSNYTGLLAHNDELGSIFVNGVDKKVTGIPDEWRVDGSLFYITEGEVWILYPNGTTEFVIKATHIAPKPGSLDLDAIQTVSTSSQLLYNNIETGIDGSQQDWYGK